MVQMNKELVNRQIDDWIDRLNQLYDKFDDWVAAIPHDRTKRETLKQPLEPRMRQFHVAARSVPTYTIFSGKQRVSFVPAALWVPGTNGRVNITTNHKQYILVDGANGDNGSKWYLVMDDFDHPLAPFGKKEFLGLLAEGE